MGNGVLHMYGFSPANQLGFSGLVQIMGHDSVDCIHAHVCRVTPCRADSTAYSVAPASTREWAQANSSIASEDVTHQFLCSGPKFDAPVKIGSAIPCVRLSLTPGSHCYWGVSNCRRKGWAGNCHLMKRTHEAHQFVAPCHNIMMIDRLITVG